MSLQDLIEEAGGPDTPSPQLSLDEISTTTRAGLGDLLEEAGVPSSESGDGTGALGAAWEALEQLRRPQAAAFQTAITGSPVEGMKELINFEARPTFSDVLDAGGVPQFPMRNVVAFAGDLILDPLVLVPAAKVGAGVKTAGRFGWKGVEKIEAAGVPAAAALKGLQKLFTGSTTVEGKAARRLAAKAERKQAQVNKEIEKILKSREGEFKELAERTGMPIEDVKSSVGAGVETRPNPYPKDMPAADAMVDNLGGSFAGKSGDEIFDTGAAVLETMAKTGKYDPFIGSLNQSSEAKNLASKMIGELKERGEHVLRTEKSNLKRAAQLQSERVDYILHAIRPEARRVLIDRGIIVPGKYAYSWSPKHASLLERTIKDKSIQEVNELALAGKLDLLGDGVKMPLFVDDPAFLEATRLYRSSRAVVSANLLDDTIKQFGQKFTKGEAAKGRSGWRRVEIEGYDDFWLPKEAAETVNSYWVKATDQAVVNKFIKVWDEAQNSWKAWTLAVFPEYHFRNNITNLWNNYLAGMGPEQTKHYHTAARLLSLQNKANYRASSIKKILGDFDTLGEATKAKDLDEAIKLGRYSGTPRQLLDEMVDEGITRGGIFGAELAREEQALSGLTKGLGKVRRFAQGENLAVKKGFQYGTALEDWARSAHYVWRRSAGDTAEKAALSVKKSLFNYDELDPFTENMRRVIPFLTWSRFNIPYQLEHLVTDPWKTSLVNKFRNHIETEAGTNKDMDERFVAEYVRRGMAVRTRKTGDGQYEAFLLDNWVPLSDLNEIGLLQLRDGAKGLAENLGPWAFNMLSPFITSPIEIGMGKSVFLGRDFLPEKKRFLGMNLTERQQNILRTIRALTVIDRFVVSPRKQSTGSAVIRTLTGINTIPIDERRGRAAHAAKTRRKITELRSGIKRAERRGNPEAAEDLREHIRKLIEESGEAI